ncbi:MAG: ABC transporter substrate-binding protein, partial [Candidatus Eremiobacteraeota bacterium]|nr:ABC transporter substrate-binding protein [Candidatus Eremiobacteraeota bacterium]
AGARNAVTRLPGAYGQYSGEALLALQPDAILTDDTTGVMQVLGREPWRSLTAVQRGHIIVLHDPSILERPGPRYNEGLKWLIERLQPISK